MTSALLQHEPLLRVGCFLLVFLAMAAWEIAAPRRAPSLSRRDRWPRNIGIVVLDTLVVRVLFPGAAVGLALLAEERGWGLLAALELPAWLAVVLAVVALDFAIYLQHVMFHAVPAFWRIHRMHHADLDFDVTTGTRFHPIEIVLSMLIKFAVIVAIGAPAVAVLIFEVLLNATSMFTHGNVRLGPRLDRVLRSVIVTPEMHRVHHSVHRNETNSNFGFNLSWWDRLLGTYRAQPRDGHEGMTIGLENLRDRRACVTLGGMLMIPFSSAGGGYAINERGG